LRVKTVALPSGDRGRPLAAPQLAELDRLFAPPPGPQPLEML